jgi:hypothetical protein
MIDNPANRSGNLGRDDGSPSGLDQPIIPDNWAINLTAAAADRDESGPII